MKLPRSVARSPGSCKPPPPVPYFTIYPSAQDGRARRVGGLRARIPPEQNDLLASFARRALAIPPPLGGTLDSGNLFSRGRHR